MYHVCDGMFYVAEAWKQKPDYDQLSVMFRLGGTVISVKCEVMMLI